METDLEKYHNRVMRVRHREGIPLSLDSDSSIISNICEEPAKSLALEMSPAAQRQTNTALISSLRMNDNQQPCVFVMNGN